MAYLQVDAMYVNNLYLSSYDDKNRNYTFSKNKELALKKPYAEMAKIARFIELVSCGYQKFRVVEC